MHTSIRLASLADLDAIISLNSELFAHDSPFDASLDHSFPNSEVGRDYFLSHIDGREGVAFVAEQGDQLVGYLAGGFCDPAVYRHPMVIAELGDMFVCADFRKHGIGTALVERFFDWCRDQGASRVMVSAYCGNRAAISFYESLAFMPYCVNLEREL